MGLPPSFVNKPKGKQQQQQQQEQEEQLSQGAFSAGWQRRPHCVRVARAILEASISSHEPCLRRSAPVRYEREPNWRDATHFSRCKVLLFVCRLEHSCFNPTG